jgi:hypothetical protein
VSYDRHNMTMSSEALWVPAPEKVVNLSGLKGTFLYKGEVVYFCFGVMGAFLGSVIYSSRPMHIGGPTIMNGQPVVSTIEAGNRE